MDGGDEGRSDFLTRNSTSQFSFPFACPLPDSVSVSSLLPPEMTESSYRAFCRVRMQPASICGSSADLNLRFLPFIACRKCEKKLGELLASVRRRTNTLPSTPTAA